MKILFYTPQPVIHDHMEADYQSDLLFHGLRSMLGRDCVDYPKKDHMYKGYNNPELLWGKGFTYSCLLDDIIVDRGDLESKLRNNYFDCIVFSIHHTMQMDYNGVFNLMRQLQVPQSKLVVVDGHDWTKFCPEYFQLVKKFFKREIADDMPQHVPVWFSIPKEQIVDEVPEKVKDFSFITPGSCESHWPAESRDTHVYETQEEYYQDYRESSFALTCKKGGWDCMRHYEIMAQGCIPIFTDLEDCPANTCYSLPKNTLLTIKGLDSVRLARLDGSKDKNYGGHLIDTGKSSVACDNTIIYEYGQHLLDYTKTHLTTEALATHVLSHIKDD